jgi:hypothetical protein
VSGFVKLYASILDSSVWAESKDTRLVWVTMLAMADQHGIVEASIGGLARRAAVSREECEAALLVLSSPDPDDKSGVDEGRRIAKIDRGWHITNHAAYREFRTETQIATAERVRKFRQREKAVTGNDVTPGNAEKRPVRAEADREAESDQEGDPSDRRAGLDVGEGEPVLVLTPPAPGPSPTEKQRADAAWVFECWKHDTGHHRATFDAKRQARIRARLRDGFTREQLREAIQNRRNSLHLMGQNETGTVYDGIETLLRDAAQVERLLRLTEPERPRTGAGSGQRAADQLERQLARANALRESERNNTQPIKALR